MPIDLPWALGALWPTWLQRHCLSVCLSICPPFPPPLLTPFSTQAKILEHDNVNYLKKILGELGMVLDQIEAELEKRKLEYQGRCWAAYLGSSPTPA